MISIEQPWFLTQALSDDRSCQRAVNDAAVKRLLGGLPPCSTHTGAYCRARKRLPLSMLESLKRHTGQVVSQQCPRRWRWRGRPVRLVDGTTISMPDTLENQAAYPQLSMQKPGLGFPLCRLVALLDSALSPVKGKGNDEQSLLRSLLHHLEPGDVLLGDAYYATYFLYCSLQEQGVDAVFEQQGSRRLNTDFRKGKRLGTKDHLITLNKPQKCPHWMSREAFDRAPDTVVIRELLTGGKILVTTLLNARKTSKKALKALYKQRWHIELDLRNIKTTLGMETLNCRSVEMIRKEIEVYLLAYNLIRHVMLQSALLADIMPRQISFKHALQLWLIWQQQVREADDLSATSLLVLIAQREVGNRPGRIEPRAVKRRPKPYPRLMKDRQTAREEIRKNGHPKKLK